MMKRPKDLIFVIFGASGDLTYRKLIPAIYSLKQQNMLPEKFAILGVSVTEMTREAFQEKMKEGIMNFTDKKEHENGKIDEFIKQLDYLPINFNDSNDFNRLKEKLSKIDKEYGTDENYIYYFAVPPHMFGVLAGNLHKTGLSKKADTHRIIIVEKPFGYDYDSAKKLNDELLKFFKEEKIFRIDHYLGKETVQNMFVTRFANGIFEPLWNRNYIHHVEITSAENIGIENRGRYYETAGALRDMLQNHLLQEVSLVAMEPPSSLDSESIRNEKLKVIQSLRPIKEEDVKSCVVRGQYTASTVNGKKLKAYREEEGVNPESKTETFVAMKFYIDNWRWGGVPFYIRTGKRLPTMVNEIVIHFKPTPHLLFRNFEEMKECNQLVIRIQPDDGILIKFAMKLPGEGYEMKLVDMDFHYKDLSVERIPSAYERLLFDAMHEDSTLFLRGDAVEAAWKFVMPVLNAWKNDHKINLYGYPAGTWGPETADDLIEEPDKGWRYPCKNLTDVDVYCKL